MAIAFFLLALICIALLAASLVQNKRLEKRVAERDAEARRLLQYHESETLRIQTEAQTAVAKAQELVDQQLAQLAQESERFRQHYEALARQAKADAQAMVEATQKKFEPLQQFEGLRAPDAEATRLLSEALRESSALRNEAHRLVEHARAAAADERSRAAQQAKDLRRQADAILNQATVDAGRMTAAAEKRAEQIGGDAYIALRDKQTLEQAVQALWNVANGYGDR